MDKLKMNCGYCGRKCSLEKDFCIPQDSVYVCKSCYEWQSKIADLEAKLAESEKKYNNLFDTFKKCQEADRKFKNEQYQEDLKLIDDLEKAENDAYKLRYELAGADETISQLKQQLAELDSELSENVRENEFLKEQLAEKEKTLQLACDELEDAKDMLRDCNKNEWSSLLNSSADYFKSKAKGEK